jgi:tetratricopeptide (TPR) repeat protein
MNPTNSRNGLGPSHAFARRALVVVLAASVVALGACAKNRPADTAQASTPGTPGALDEAMALVDQAQQARTAGNLDKAIELNQRATQVRDDLGIAWNNLGVCLMEKELNLGAIEALKRASDLLPSDPRPLENIGLLYHNLGWSKDALEYYALALERDPNWLPALRGAVLSQKAELLSNTAGLERAKRGQFIETDPRWKEIFRSEAMRIEQDIAEQNRSGAIRT